MDKGASPEGDRATHERSQSSLSPPTVGIPSALETAAQLCREAGEPSLELDVIIAAAAGIADNLHSYQQPDRLLGSPFFRASADGRRVEVGTLFEGEDRIVATREPRPFTTSLDAAVTLIPAGWGFKADCNLGYGCTFTVGHVGPNKFFDKPDSWGKGATPALALCAAALEARAVEIADLTVPELCGGCGARIPFHEHPCPALASAIEARRVETNTDSAPSSDESAVAKPDAQGPRP